MFETSAIGVLLQLGVAGVMLAWFMFRIERRMDAGTRAQDRTSRSILLLVVSLSSAEPVVREQARQIMREIPAPAPAPEHEEAPWTT